jgi:hypothetical protein
LDIGGLRAHRWLILVQFRMDYQLTNIVVNLIKLTLMLTKPCGQPFSLKNREKGWPQV